VGLNWAYCKMKTALNETDPSDCPGDHNPARYPSPLSSLSPPSSLLSLLLSSPFSPPLLPFSPPLLPSSLFSSPLSSSPLLYECNLGGDFLVFSCVLLCVLCVLCVCVCVCCVLCVCCVCVLCVCVNLLIFFFCRVDYGHTVFESFLLSGIGLLIFIVFASDHLIFKQWVTLSHSFLFLFNHFLFLFLVIFFFP
jgi:hypothetical protein